MVSASSDNFSGSGCTHENRYNICWVASTDLSFVYCLFFHCCVPYVCLKLLFEIAVFYYLLCILFFITFIGSADVRGEDRKRLIRELGRKPSEEKVGLDLSYEKLLFIFHIEKLSYFYTWSTKMVFCYRNFSHLPWEKIVLVIDKNFWNSNLKAKNL